MVVTWPDGDPGEEGKDGRCIWDCSCPTTAYFLVAQMVKNPPANAGDTRDMGSISGLERSLKEGNGKPLQYSGLENSVDRGVWQATVYRDAESQTQLSMCVHTHTARGKGYYGITDNRFKNTFCGYIFLGTSLVVQWLRIHLSMQGTQVQTLLQDDPMCHGATNTLSHNY